jgi:hypothetical protein
VVPEHADPRRGAGAVAKQADAAPYDEEGGPRVTAAEDAGEPDRVRARPVVEGQREVPAAREGAIDRLGALDEPAESGRRHLLRDERRRGDQHSEHMHAGSLADAAA